MPTSDRDVQATALIVFQRHGGSSSYYARGRAETLRGEGAHTDAETWEKVAQVCEDWEREPRQSDPTDPNQAIRFYDKFVEVAHKDAIDNLLATKREQGTVTVVTLAAMAGIFGAGMSWNIELIRWLSLVPALVGIGMLDAFQKHMKKMRDRLKGVYANYIPREDRDLLELRIDVPPLEKAEDSIRVYRRVIIVAYVVIVLLLSPIIPDPVGRR